jgi:hypothetical protein
MWKNIVEPGRSHIIHSTCIVCWITNATKHTQNMYYLLLSHCNNGCRSHRNVTSYVHCMSFLHKLMHIFVLCRDNLHVALKFQAPINNILDLVQMIGWVISHLVLSWDISTVSEISPSGPRSAVSCWRWSLVKWRVWVENCRILSLTIEGNISRCTRVVKTILSRIRKTALCKPVNEAAILYANENGSMCCLVTMWSNRCYIISEAIYSESGKSLCTYKTGSSI